MKHTLKDSIAEVKHVREMQNRITKERLEQELEIDFSDFQLGYIKGYVAGFKKGSQVEKTEGTEICFITKLTVGDKEFDYEFCEIIKE